LGKKNKTYFIYYDPNVIVHRSKQRARSEGKIFSENF